MDKVETTKTRVIEAAKVCPDAQRVLKELFPEAFKEEWVDCTKECGARLCDQGNAYDIELYRKSDGHRIAGLWANGHITEPIDGYRIIKETDGDKDSVFIIEHKGVPR